MILCIESATSICSVALADGDRILAIREINVGFAHAEKLTVFVDEVFEEAGKKLQDLKTVALSGGPGSYTGLRIGASVAKGLCLSLGIPLISVPTLEAMTVGALKKVGEKKDFLLCPMIDARRMEVYCLLCDADLNSVMKTKSIVVNEELFSEQNIEKQIYFFGDGAEKCREILSNNAKFIFLPDVFPSASNIALVAARKLLKKEFEDLILFEPFYLKEYTPGVKK